MVLSVDLLTASEISLTTNQLIYYMNDHTHGMVKMLIQHSGCFMLIGVAGGLAVAADQ